MKSFIISLVKLSSFALFFTVCFGILYIKSGYARDLYETSGGIVSMLALEAQLASIKVWHVLLPLHFVGGYVIIQFFEMLHGENHGELGR